MKEILVSKTTIQNNDNNIVKPCVKHLKTFNFSAYCGCCNKFKTKTCEYKNDKRMSALTNYSIFNCTSFSEL